MCYVNYPKFPGKICAEKVNEKDKAVQCDLCEFWIHIKCNNLNYLDYRYLQNCDESWYCRECCSTTFPINSLSSNKNFLACCTNTDSDSNFGKLELLVNQFNKATPKNNNNPAKVFPSIYYNINDA